jgi:hypothetical protein
VGHAQRRGHQQTQDNAANGQAFAGKPVSVAELEQNVQLDEKKRDSVAAKELSRLRLTERLSNANLTHLKAALPGARSREALVALADASAFLDPPATEISGAPAPDPAEERKIIALMVNYLGSTLPKLPNFYATRSTVRYDDASDDPYAPAAPLHKGGVSSATVVYSDGKEIVDPGPLKRKQANPEEMGLVASGTFGPILSTVVGDASRSQMKFSRWEKGTDSLLAVFRVAVPKDKSHYQVTYRNPSQTQATEQPVAYHGELSIDPATGAILYVTVQADLEPGVEVVHADTMVEYGPVDIGGKTYICPMRSVSLSQGRSRKLVYRNAIEFDGRLSLGPQITRLNDVTFANFHLFRAEGRLLTGDEMAPVKKQ